MFILQLILPDAQCWFRKGWEASALHLQHSCYSQTIDFSPRALQYCLLHCCQKYSYPLSQGDLCSKKHAPADFHLYFTSVVLINSRWPLKAWEITRCGTCQEETKEEDSSFTPVFLIQIQRNKINLPTVYEIKLSGLQIPYRKKLI